MKKNKIKRMTKTIRWLVVVLLVLFGGIMALSALNLPGGLRLYTVQSGSMEPAILTGSVVMIQSSENYNKGDIITYKSEIDRENPNPEVTTTHRIENVKLEGNETFYTTKGDANNSADGEPVPKDLVLGKVMLSVPYLGYLMAFTRTQTGFLALIIIPATIIVYTELLNIKNEAKILIDKRKKKKTQKKDQKAIHTLMDF